MVTFKEGLSYPWINGKRLWNILWILVPILGFFAIFGYTKKIVVNLVNKRLDGIPEFGKFWDNVSIGFSLFLRFIPLYLVIMIVNFIPDVGGILTALFQILFLPWLTINLFMKGTVKSTFEFETVMNVVFKNFGDYVVTFIKTAGYYLTYIVLSVVLVGIPCIYFGGYYYFADFYSRTSKVKKVNFKPIKKAPAPKKSKKKIQKKVKR